MSRTFPLPDLRGAPKGCTPLAKSHCISDIKRASHMKSVTLNGMWPRCDQLLQLIIPVFSSDRDWGPVDTTYGFQSFF